MRTILIPCIAMVLVATVGCGGSGRDGGQASPPATGAVLGTRSVPGYDLTVRRESGADAVHLAITMSGSSVPASVTVWLADEAYVSGATGAPAERGNDGQWRVALPLPTGGAPVCAWVRIVAPDGGILEVGRDFRL